MKQIEFKTRIARMLQAEYEAIGGDKFRAQLSGTTAEEWQELFGEHL
jgi:hypothetical protein